MNFDRSANITPTLADLLRIAGKQKAEIVNGKVVLMSPTGIVPGRAGGRIYRSLAEYEDDFGGGYAVPDNVGFGVNLPNRKSFSPDAAFYTGELPDDGAYADGAPAFAAEVRSENDYGGAKDEAILQKIADYFAAGTEVVWDVDVLREGVVRRYRKGEDMAKPTVFHRGETADGEPAVPGWRLAVDKLIP
ncbi:MAG: Uma2 family endonuclease [Akkermansiaceae bacterium]|nr:Uma2 family endonuclease [Armatimonadota bacterium]